MQDKYLIIIGIVLALIIIRKAGRELRRFITFLICLVIAYYSAKYFNIL